MDVDALSLVSELDMWNSKWNLLVRSEKLEKVILRKCVCFVWAYQQDPKNNSQNTEKERKIV